MKSCSGCHSHGPGRIVELSMNHLRSDQDRALHFLLGVKLKDKTASTGTVSIDSRTHRQTFVGVAINLNIEDFFARELCSTYCNSLEAKRLEVDRAVHHLPVLHPN